MNNQKFNGKRLKEALLLREKKMTELANETGISKQSLSLYANDANTPPFDNVVKVAKALNLPTDFFMMKDRCSVATGNTYFRSQATATKKARNAQKIKLEYVAKIYEALLNYIDFPKLNLPVLNGFSIPDDAAEAKSEEACEEIERLAEEVRKYWGIDAGPIDNLQYYLESNGIIVTGFCDVSSDIDAFSQQIEVDGKAVFIIALALGTKPIGRLRFDMAHELGHILMHSWGDDNENISRDEFNAREWQANYFASAFLLPKETFTRSVSAYPSNVDYYNSLKKKWGVSMQAMMFRARTLKIVTDNQFQYMMRIISKNGWRTREPGDVPGNIRDTVFQGAIDLLFDGGYVTVDELLNSISEYGVDMFQEDLEKLMCVKAGSFNQGTKVISFLSVKNGNN